MKVGVVGLGYVGLPLAIVFAEAGHDVVGVDADPRRVAAIGDGESYIEDIPSERLQAVGERISATTRLCRAGRLRRGADRRPHAADAQPRARPGPAASPPAPRWRGCSRQGSWSCSSRRPTRAPPASGWCRCSRSPASRPAPTSTWRSRPERIDPGRTDHTMRNTPKIVGGLTPACLDRAVALYCAGLRRDRPGLGAGAGRAREAARERLPLGQHRARQRDRDPLRPDGDRHLGGRRGGRDQALWVHALRSRSRHGRPLPAGRPLLPVVAGARVRHCRPTSSSSPARSTRRCRVLRRADRARPERPLEARARLAHRGDRRLLQGRRRRPARVAGDEDHEAARRARRRSRLPRRPRARPARVRARERLARRRASRAPTPP